MYDEVELEENLQTLFHTIKYNNETPKHTGKIKITKLERSGLDSIRCRAVSATATSDIHFSRHMTLSIDELLNKSKGVSIMKREFLNLSDNS